MQLSLRDEIFSIVKQQKSEDIHEISMELQNIQTVNQLLTEEKQLLKDSISKEKGQNSLNIEKTFKIKEEIQ